MTTWTDTDEGSALRARAARALRQRTAEIVETLHADLETVDHVVGTADLACAFARFAGFAARALGNTGDRDPPPRASEVMDRVHAGVRQLALQRCHPLIVSAMMLRALKDLQRAVDAHQVTVFLLDAG